MNLVLITDAWLPQVNGVVTTLLALKAYLERRGWKVHLIHPGLFDTRACPGYPQIRLAKRPAKALRAMLDPLLAGQTVHALHIATEGPLGWAGRRYCLQRGLAFSTAFHTKFPETLKATWGVPVGLGYAVVRHFHGASSSVMVPSRSVFAGLVDKGFRHLKTWTHGVDVQQFTFAATPQDHPAMADRARPHVLFAGRVSHEKNIDHFLALPLPGSKFVVGDGPARADLQARYPGVVWLGMQDKPQLAQAYRSADVLAFPSLTDTFGLVMIEAMACGTPVAAFPVDGPLEVLDAAGMEGTPGGVMHPHLAEAIDQAMRIPRQAAHGHARRFSWEEAGRQFVSHLVPLHPQD